MRCTLRDRWQFGTWELINIDSKYNMTCVEAFHEACLCPSITFGNNLHHILSGPCSYLCKRSTGWFSKEEAVNRNNLDLNPRNRSVPKWTLITVFHLRLSLKPRCINRVLILQLCIGTEVTTFTSRTSLVYWHYSFRQRKRITIVTFSKLVQIFTQ